MSEPFLRALATRYGLTVEKSITTGWAHTGHFATFELTGDAERCRDAFPTIRAEARGPAFDYLRHSDADGSLYIGCESVWCDADKGGAA